MFVPAARQRSVATHVVGRAPYWQGIAAKVQLQRDLNGYDAPPRRLRAIGPTVAARPARARVFSTSSSASPPPSPSAAESTSATETKRTAAAERANPRGSAPETSPTAAAAALRGSLLQGDPRDRYEQFLASTQAKWDPYHPREKSLYEFLFFFLLRYFPHSVCVLSEALTVGEGSDDNEGFCQCWACTDAVAS
jgi:hypothetical protein